MKNIETAISATKNSVFVAALEKIPRIKRHDLANLLIEHGFKPATLVYQNEEWNVFAYLIGDSPEKIAHIGTKWDWEAKTQEIYLVLPLDLRRELYAAKLLKRTIQTNEVLTLAKSLAENEDILKLPEPVVA